MSVAFGISVGAVPAFGASSDPWLARTAVAFNLGGSVLGSYPDAAGASYDGSGTVVVDIDGAFHPENPYLNIIGEACFGQPVGTTPWPSLCNTNNFVRRPLAQNPYTGYYFSALAGSSKPSNSPVSSCIEPASQTFCHNFHGTATAGTINGRQATRWESATELSYSVGAAKGASVFAIKVGGGTGSSTGWPIESVIDALNYVNNGLLTRQDIGSKIVAVNLSVAGTFRPSGSSCTADAVRINAIAATLKAKGVAVIMAAGNDGGVGIGGWSCGSNIIRVGATGLATPTVLTSYSNVDWSIQLYAPVGEGNYLAHDTLLVPYQSSGLTPAAGTSFASAEVAGVFAVLRQKFGKAPSVDSLLRLLQSSGRALTGADSNYASLSAKVVNLPAALNRTP
ncbi:hypothetical protein UM93_15105 [Psychromicrobium lacuslunae]|uniref:Peptidase S8/S53 domain-containing protein n=1 Tax=Psychromicrobium lacuslunae TaxID=1618207 RepID=A0A0D4C1R8_9MICC|nr:hypothetical protein UM93_15105 [Psychromicrobium lacuslunae]